jgi:uncharacterized protein (UPF0548 family)
VLLAVSNELGQLGLMLLLRNPTADDIHHFLASLRDKPLTYSPVGLTRDAGWWVQNKDALVGFNLDHDSILLGRGEETYRLAIAALRQWKMFPAQFASLFWPSIAPEVGHVVVAGFQLSRFGRLWSLNPCRVVYSVDEVLTENNTQHLRHGFGYGTLPGHVARGEEQFLVTWDTDSDEVRYEISSYSWPDHLLTRLATPFVRWQQKRFRTLSCQAMLQAVENSTSLSLQHQISDRHQTPKMCSSPASMAPQ